MSFSPPKIVATFSTMECQEWTSFEHTLQSMGFQHERIIKALATTGYQGVSQATDWLLNHIHDPVVDKFVDREYFLYAVPGDELATNLYEFWELSKQKCGWNGAHDYFPHVTLVPPFKVSDFKTKEIINVLNSIVKNHDLSLLNTMKLQKYISLNYVGLFITNDSSNFLKNFSQHLVSELSSRGILCSTQDKPFHLTLAYKFHSDHYNILKCLAEVKININLPCKWRIKLFSRDPTYAFNDVYKCVEHYSPVRENELELPVGDLIYLNETVTTISADKWVEGTSWLTGLKGHLPLSYVERTAITDTWAELKISAEFEVNELPSSNSKITSRILPVEEMHKSVENLYDDKDAKGFMKSAVSESRELYIMRHGERIDFTFGKWIPFSFDKNGKYVRKDLNMPKAVPNRSGGHQAFSKDSPLTNIGELQARWTGEAMKENGIKIEHVFVSPSLRCIQTGHSLLSGLGIENVLKLKIEPGLFEWTAWYPDSLPDWMTVMELSAFGFNIDFNYSPVISETCIKKKKETLEEFYNRGSYVTTTLLNRTEKLGGNILFVGHSMTLDVCSRQLVGKQPRMPGDVSRILPNIHYCSILCLHQSDNDAWYIKEPVFPSITHSNNMKFDHTILL